MKSSDNALEEAYEAEIRRCRALEATDEAVVASLLHPHLVYVHSNGHIDDGASYLARSFAPGVRFRRIERSDFQAWRVGDVVLMNGKIMTDMERDGHRSETIAFVTQAYVKDTGGWKMAMLHATKDTCDERAG